jgi:hypothetical protein
MIDTTAPTVLPVARKAVMPDVSFGTASEALPVRTNTQP